MKSSSLRTLTLFAGINSMAIAFATQAKNNQVDRDEITKQLRDTITGELRKETTASLFYAAGKVLSDADYEGMGTIHNTLQDAIIDEFSAIITNDVLTFVFRDDKHQLPTAKTSKHDLALVEKRAKVNTASSDISDELRDELSGANVVAGAGDNDCGDACKI